MQLERRSLKKIRASTGFEPVTSALPVRSSTNWAMKPHTGSEVNLLIWIISYILHFISLLTGDMNSIHWPRSQCVASYIAQLVEQRTSNAEVTGSNPVETLIFFSLLLSNCLNWKITAMIILHFHLQPQFKNELFHIYLTLY